MNRGARPLRGRAPFRVEPRVVDGRTHRLSLEPDVLSEAADWMDRQRALWGRLFDVVDEYLKEERPR